MVCSHLQRVCLLRARLEACLADGSLTAGKEINKDTVFDLLARGRPPLFTADHGGRTAFGVAMRGITQVDDRRVREGSSRVWKSTVRAPKQLERLPYLPADPPTPGTPAGRPPRPPCKYNERNGLGCRTGVAWEAGQGGQGSWARLCREHKDGEATRARRSRAKKRARGA